MKDIVGEKWKRHWVQVIELNVEGIHPEEADASIVVAHFRVSTSPVVDVLTCLRMI